MILPLIFTLSFSYDKNHSILAPFKSSAGVREVGFYSLRGSALPLKTSIRITPSSNGSNFGGVCGYHSIPYDNFSVQFAFDDLDHESILEHDLMFTTELCPEKTRMFHGFAVKILSSQNSNTISVFFHENHGTFSDFDKTPKCSFNISATKRGYKSLVTFSKGRIDVKIGRPNEDFITCFETSGVKDVINGYLSLFSKSSNLSTYEDLKYIAVLPHSKINDSIIDNDAKNLKYLTKAKSRIMNMRLRQMRQPTNKFFYDQMEFNNNELFGVSNRDQLKSSFKEIKESMARCGMGLRYTELKSFILSTVDEQISTALHKLQYLANSLVEFHQEFNDIYVSTAIVMLDIQATIRISQNDINHTAGSIIRSIGNRSKPNNNKNIESNQLTNSVDDYLTVVCAFEMILFLVFFIIKRRRTSDFKKYD